MNRLHNTNTRATNWMRQLAFQYEYIRKSYPEDRLMIVFDIDGTILDTRYAILSVLKAYDREHGTSFFASLCPESLSISADEMLSLFSDINVPAHKHNEVMLWCMKNFWPVQSLTESLTPYKGVFDAIRWFQLQPNMYVGLNTGRDESLRALTLASLNAVGREYRVEFSDHHLYMNRGGDVLRHKAEGIQYFEDQGYRVFAMVDNEPANLKAIYQHHRDKDILLLHAHTIFETSPIHIPENTATGMHYDLTELIQEKSLPPHVQFVWHGVNDESILRQFLASNVRWAELHVRYDTAGDRMILRRRKLEDLPLEPGEKIIPIDEFLSMLLQTDRGVKLDIKNVGLIERVIKILKNHGFEDDRIWVNSSLYKIQKSGLKSLTAAFPGSIRQTPIDFLSPLLFSSPNEFREHLKMLNRFGFNRFSVNWKTGNCRRIVTGIQTMGFDVNIYNVPDLEAFLQAILLMPRSVTSYFNFPKWFYYGSDVAALWVPYELRKIA